MWERTVQANQRVTVPEAAELLGITAEAVRMRIKRGTLRSERQAGRVFVLLGQSQPTEQPTDRPDESNALISQMQGRIDSLERQLEEAAERDRENRRIIVALTSRIPAIEAPRESPDPPVSPAPNKDHTEGSEGPETGSLSTLPESVVSRIGAFALVVLLGLSVCAVLADAALREEPYVDPWAFMSFALFLLPIGFGFSFGFLTVGNLTSRNGTSALLAVLPGLLLTIVVGGGLMAYVSIVVVRLLYSIPASISSPQVVLVPAGVSFLGALFFMFSALVGHALHRQRANESASSPHALSPLQQGLLGVLGAIITAVFGFCGVLVQVFFAAGGTP